MQTSHAKSDPNILSRFTAALPVLRPEAKESAKPFAQRVPLRSLNSLTQKATGAERTGNLFLCRLNAAVSEVQLL